MDLVSLFVSHARPAVSACLAFVVFSWCSPSALAGGRAAVAAPQAASPFLLKLDRGAITSLRRAGDSFPTEYIAADRRLGEVKVTCRRPGEEWWSGSANAGTVGPNGRQDLELTSAFQPTGERLDWTITLRNASDHVVEVGDLALPLPMARPFRREKDMTPLVLKHHFISGDTSWIFWMRSNSIGPYLAFLPQPGTHLEYWEADRAAFSVFVHSVAAGAVAKSKGTKWRQPHTSLTLRPGQSRSYGFTFAWAKDYADMRRLIARSGMVDVQAVPGMTIPTDLTTRLAFASSERIRAVEAEFPDRTTVTPLGARNGHVFYAVRFRHLGENLLTVRYGRGRVMRLEFFATEPVETLIKKRAAFLARSQHRDPSKWYYGLITDWNMRDRVRPSPDNYDLIKGFRIYAVTCDDPGLGKPAYLAAKLAEYPDQAQVDAMDLYLQHFVWGGLQRTTDETYPYAIYGIQDWKRNRESEDPGKKGRLHLWRPYDYPHVVLMYYGMYRVAKHQPGIRTALSAQDYLRRAFGTARAMFTVPLEIDHWSAFETGFYNEVILPDVARALEAEGMQAEARELRELWNRKVKFFVLDKPDLFQSEYAFDSTGFESTHALAKTAIELAEDPASGISTMKARAFLDAQIAANLFCRGWLEPAYYYLGSDYRGGGGNAYTLTYMSQMGGWSVLDYALHYAGKPSPMLRLGYASILSAWALMNTGTPESNFGYWYPGRENDGGAGGGFEPAPYGQTWLGMPHSRGSWFYGSEIDLGFSGALRAAATIIADDDLFGRIAYGGDWTRRGSRLLVVPKDGVRRRFHALLAGKKLHLELENDRYAAGEAIAIRPDLAELAFRLESDDATPHMARLAFSAPAGTYEVSAGGRTIARVTVKEEERPVSVDLPVGQGAGECRIRRVGRPGVH